MSEALTGKGDYKDFRAGEEKEPDEIIVMRVLGMPPREQVQEFMKQMGAGLAGAYKIWSGIANPNSPKREEMDGVIFMFSMSHTDLGTSLERNADIRVGFDMTDYYKEGFQSQSNQRQNDERPQLPPLNPQS